MRTGLRFDVARWWPFRYSRSDRPRVGGVGCESRGGHGLQFADVCGDAGVPEPGSPVRLRRAHPRRDDHRRPGRTREARGRGRCCSPPGDARERPVRPWRHRLPGNGCRRGRQGRPGLRHARPPGDRGAAVWLDDPGVGGRQVERRPAGPDGYRRPAADAVVHEGDAGNRRWLPPGPGRRRRQRLRLGDAAGPGDAVWRGAGRSAAATGTRCRRSAATRTNRQRPATGASPRFPT